MSPCQQVLLLTLPLSWFATLSLGKTDSFSSCMTSDTEVDDKRALKAGSDLFYIKVLLFPLEMTV